MMKNVGKVDRSLGLYDPFFIIEPGEIGNAIKMISDRTVSFTYDAIVTLAYIETEV